MKKVYLVRHARSSWRDTKVSDQDRPLKPKGIHEAYEMAGKVADADINPELLISSPAIRSMHTAIIFARAMHHPIHRIAVTAALYEKGKEQLIKMLKEVDEKYDTVMVFGHDPALTNLLNDFAGKEIEKLQGCEVIGLKLTCRKWKSLKKCKARVVFNARPKRG